MKKTAFLLCIAMLFVATSCNQVLSVFVLTTGVMRPKYQTTEKSIQWFEKKTGYHPEFFAIPKDKATWEEMQDHMMFPFTRHFNAFGQEISYDSVKICMGRAMKFGAQLGKEDLPMVYLPNEDIDDLRNDLQFVPEMVFDPVELGAKYDYALFVFFFNGLLKRQMQDITRVIDSTAANPYAKVAIIPVCVDADKSLFTSRREFRKCLYTFE